MNKKIFNSAWDFLIILVILISPIIVNWIVKADFGFIIAGDQNGWLAFYGALVGSLITMFVLYKTLKRSHEENEYNRNLQLSILKYQQKTAWINELKSSLINLKLIYDTMLFFQIRIDIIDNRFESAAEKIRKKTLDLDVADTSIGFLFPELMSVEEQSFFKRKLDVMTDYGQILSNLSVLNDLLKDCPARNQFDYFLVKINNLKQSDNGIPEYQKCTIVINAITSVGFENVTTHIQEIVDEIVRPIAKLDLTFFMHDYLQLIDYENNIANKLLEI